MNEFETETYEDQTETEPVAKNAYAAVWRILQEPYDHYRNLLLYAINTPAISQVNHLCWIADEKGRPRYYGVSVVLLIGEEAGGFVTVKLGDFADLPKAAQDWLKCQRPGDENKTPDNPPSLKKAIRLLNAAIDLFN